MKQPLLPGFKEENGIKEENGAKEENVNKKLGEVFEEIESNETLDLDHKKEDIQTFIKKLYSKDTCKLNFFLFGEYFDVEIINGWINIIEVSGLTFKYSYSEKKFIVVMKQKGFIWKKAYEYKALFLKWIKENKAQYRTNLHKNTKPHPYFDEFLGK